MRFAAPREKTPRILDIDRRLMSNSADDYYKSREADHART